MAVSIEAAFILIDRASGPLKDIRREAALTNKELRGLGSGGGGLSATSQINTFDKSMEKAGKTAKTLGSEIDKTGRRVDETGNFFKRSLTRINDWRKSLTQAHPVLGAFKAGLGGVLGGLKGVATALPLMAYAALAAAPAIVSLTGVVGALASSLALAVGGGALLGGGLIGSFVVGLGSIAAVAKPAVTATENYMKAVKALNTAIASGSPTAIKARQQQLDQIAKANPGVAKLATNLTKFRSEWKKATAPAREDFFKLAADGMQTVRNLLPTLAGEANKNTAALQSSFQKILQPFLESGTFKGLITGLGGIFRANLPGFMSGLTNIISGLANILKVLTPQLDKAGSAFQGFTQKFANWTATSSGRNGIRDMGKSFSEWMSLLKGISRLIGDIIGVAGPKGTGLIAGWAEAVNKLADKLSQPGGKSGINNFFTKTLDAAGQLWPVLKSIAGDLAAIYKVWKPLGSVTAFIIKSFPAPVVAAITALYVGSKGAAGAIKGGAGFFGAISKLITGTRTSGGGTGVVGSIAKQFAGRGSIDNPLYVVVLDPGSGGVPGLPGKGKGGVEGDLVTATEDAAKTGLPEDAGLLSKALPFLKTGGKFLGAAGLAFTAFQAFNAITSTKGGLGAKLKAGVQAADPTSILHAVGLPSLSDVFFGDSDATSGSNAQNGYQQLAARARAQPSTPAVPKHLTAPNTGYTGLAAASRHRPGVDPATLAFGAPPPSGQPGVMPILGGQTITQISQASNAKLRKDTHDTVDYINNQWLLANKGVTGQWKDTTSDVLKESDYLHDQMHSKNKATRELATKDWTQLSDAVTAQADGMAKNITGDMATIAAQVQSGSASAAAAAQQNFGALASTTQAALKSGAMNAGEAAKLISQSLNAMLKAFGQAPIPNLGSVSAMLKWENWWSGGQGSHLGGTVGQAGGGTQGTPGRRAKGGRLPGEPRGDHLPLYGRGGNLLGIADGGELVVNRHSEAKADKFLARFGTRLGSIVAGEHMPHNARGGFAKGGRIVTASDYTGTGSASGRNAATTAGFAELSNNPGASLSSLDFSALGHLPMGTVLPVTYNGKTMRFPKIDVGAGGAGIGGHPRAIDLTYVAARELGFPVPGLANVIVGNPGGISLGGGGGGGATMPDFPHLKVPGSGTMQRIVQGSVNRMVAGANRYIGRHQPAPVAGVGGVAGVGPAGGPSGTVMDPSGKAVAKWIEPILMWARSHGWQGSVTSGYRSFAQQAAINASGAFSAKAGTSNHETTQYPGGAVDVTDPSQLISVLRGYHGARHLVGGVLGPVDPEHFSATGHALGGRLPWLAHGADFVANRPQVIGVGDGPRPERVTVTPQGQGKLGNQGLHVEIHKIEVNRKGDVQKIVDEELQLLAATIERHL